MDADEREFFYYVTVMGRRRWLILIGTLVGALLGAALAMTLPATYEASFTLAVARLRGKTLENPADVAERLRDRRVLAELIEEMKLDATPEDLAARITTEQPEESVRYRVRSGDPRLAQQLGHRLGERVIAVHQAIIDRQLKDLTKYTADLEARAQMVEQDIAAMKETLREIAKAPRTDAPAVILLQANLDDREQRLQALYQELRDLRFSLGAPESVPTSIIAADVIGRHVNPRVTINVLAGAALGLFSSILFVFYREYLTETARS